MYFIAIKQYAQLVRKHAPHTSCCRENCSVTAHHIPQLPAVALVDAPEAWGAAAPSTSNKTASGQSTSTAGSCRGDPPEDQVRMALLLSFDLAQAALDEFSDILQAKKPLRNNGVADGRILISSWDKGMSRRLEVAVGVLRQYACHTLRLAKRSGEVAEVVLQELR